MRRAEPAFVQLGATRDGLDPYLDTDEARAHPRVCLAARLGA
ncbi:hypothetical protein [Sorangium sp. So ce406]